ncbi:hypothetical protein GCM10009630_46970 [Kribbella jejuensis]|uniref:DUF6602 domain-containing protein n=1 Tax=Kribbella jejuensis TaxID=236068 RepID=A0A542EWJ6_9ACTN|nr:DUF6602 domain-containing protein [Kribbella jejuensis]TQJ19733.1 hypothetical protein FB475_3909 [Kribbella jejuensis]
MVKLADLIANAAQIMKLDLARIRLATKRAELKGGAAEEVLAKFLKQRLPGSLGITRGHVVDANGGLSKQADVIIYDALRTPILFESALDGWDVVPAEGVVAVIEVKMHLTAADIPSVVANCDSVMQLRRDAYIGRAVQTIEAYGSRWSELPIYYSVFAYESDGMYAAELNELLSSHALQDRIGSVCYLDRGVSLHADLSGAAAALVPVATELATLLDIPPPNALLLWLTALSTVVSVGASRRPIDLMRYAPEEHAELRGTVRGTSPDVARRRAEAAGQQTLTGLEMDPATAARITTMMLDSQSLTAGDLRAVEAVGGQVVPEDEGHAKLVIPTGS